MNESDEICRRRQDRQLSEGETEAVIQTVAELMVEYLRSGISVNRGPQVGHPRERLKRTQATTSAGG